MVCQQTATPSTQPVWIRATMIDDNFAVPSAYNTTLGVLYFLDADKQAVPTTQPVFEPPALSPDQVCCVRGGGGRERTAAGRQCVAARKWDAAGLPAAGSVASGCRRACDARHRCPHCRAQVGPGIVNPYLLRTLGGVAPPGPATTTLEYTIFFFNEPDPNNPNDTQ
jgi:hypothetical protein